MHPWRFVIYTFFFMNNSLQIKLFGSLQVIAGGKTAVFRTDAQRVLLAYLAAHQGQPQRRDTLAALLTPDRTDKEALTYLRNRLTRLRKAIGDDTAVPPTLRIDRKQITLRRGDDVAVDLSRFDELVTAVSHHSHRQLAGCPTCVARLETAVSLIRGDMLAGLNFPSETWQAWLTAQREHNRQRALEAMDWLRQAKMAQGEWAAVLDIARRQLQLEPWHEAAHRALMQAHAQRGDRTAALAQYDQCAQILWDELGAEPEEKTATLYQTIQAGAPDSSFILHPSSSPNNLPPPTSRFVGREAEQARLLHRLADPHYRLITLVGTGGIGKTRLAVEIGRQMTLNFPDGIWFVPLDAVQPGAGQIQRAVGEAMGLAEDGKQLTGAQVLALLRDKQALLILDNCETALTDLNFLPEWLRRAPRMAVLATSREPLAFQAESVVALDGLPLGEGDGTAESLFAERAQMAQADFAVTPENRPHIHRICELVDGSPLGIALAAAWVRRRSLAQIAAGIGQSLDLLSTRLRDVDPRHRNMRAVFEASWRLLLPEEQTALAVLSVFPAPFSAEAAVQVAGAELVALDGLCEKSLLQQQPELERYAWHTLVRRFAAEKLGEGETTVTARYIAYFHQFAHTHRQNYPAFQPEWPHLMTAAARAHARQQWAQVVDLVQTLDEAWFRQIRFQDMRQGLALAVEAATHLQDRPALVRLQLRLAEIEVELNGYDAAEAQLTAAMPLLLRLEDGWGIAQGNYLYGRIKLEQAQDDEALNLFTKARRIFEEEGDELGAGRSLNLMASCHMKLNPDYETALSLLQESIATLRGLPVSSPYVEALRYLSRVKCKLGRYAEAEPVLAEAAKVSQALQDVGEYAAVLYEQMVLYKRLAQPETALRFGYECLPLFQTLGSLRWEGLVKTQLGALHQARGQLAQAAALFREALQIFIEVGDFFEQAYTCYYLYKLYAAMGEAALSLEAKQQAQRLNQTLQIPYLTEQIGTGF